MRIAIVTFLMLIALRTPSFTQALPLLPEPDKDPFVGTWKANAEKSRPRLDKDEASYVRTISRDGDDVVSSSRQKKPGSPPLIKGRTYSEFHEWQYRIRCDGLSHPVQCGPISCSKSCTYTAPNRIEGLSETLNEKTHTNFKDYWTEEVSSDGQEMRDYAYKDEARKKLKSVLVLDRVK